MRLGGLAKLTLLDFPGHIACTLFTAGCNFRCPFCHNSPLVRDGGEENIGEEEFFTFLSKREGILDGVAITGGEPLLQKDISSFIKRIKDMGYATKLDTNGSFPERLRELIDGGLVDYVAMDIKNSPDKYPLTCGFDIDFDRVSESIRLLLEGKVEYEFRTTTVKGYHTAEDFEEIGRLISGAERYFIQRFEDSGDILTEGLSAPEREELESFLDSVKKHVPNALLRGV